MHDGLERKRYKSDGTERLAYKVTISTLISTSTSNAHIDCKHSSSLLRFDPRFKIVNQDPATALVAVGVISRGPRSPQSFHLAPILSHQI